jgi:cytochrome P450
MLDSLPTLDLNDPAYLADPYPSYAALRSEPGLVRSEALGWLISRHADVSALLHDRRLASGPINTSLYETLPEAARADIEPFRISMDNNMLFQDAPKHTRLRRLVSQAFTPRRIELLRVAIQAIVDDLLDGRRAGDRFDVIGDLAFPLPTRVIATMLGVPLDGVDQLKRWNDDAVEFLGNARTTSDPFELAQRTGASSTANRAFFRDLVQQHRAAPSDDLICAMIAIETEGERLSEDELLSTCSLLFAAGHETTTNLIGNGLLALFRNPDQLQLLIQEPELGPVAVEELLRFDSPVQFTYRVAIDDVVVGGETIPAGQLATLLLGAANRDPLAFPDPDRLDLRRRPRHYLSFGTGAHTCLGAFLARMETEIALRTLLGRFPGLTFGDEPLRWHSNPIFHGVEHLPVTL